ncbi:MAG: IS66 family insertion sequence element accessory protein TnpB [Leptospiraceae bacterium]|nr:IS66 family insertion sequence element accessory protein TnpB [Leptospiraceae bacterium]MBK7053923.1 IS66 family insertion sequence element accessory protein TnpB [Leptospiraceae bacterium]MBL0263553.1 IS66 family insertion sequence element accessory protein TnpB [Leptospiraceae bacterium]
MILTNPFQFKIFLYPQYIDMRKSWNGLIGLVQNGMNLDPFEKSLFVFCGRSQRLIKIIYWVRSLRLRRRRHARREAGAANSY